jgi:hypothetical protein
MYRTICFVGFISLVTLVCIQSNQGSQENPSASAELKKLCEESLGLFAKGENDKAFALIQDVYVKTPSENELAIMQKSYSETISRFSAKAGQPIGYEVIDEKKIGDSLQKNVYLLKFDRNVLRFSYVFYRAQDSWKILEWHYDCNFSDIVK